MSDDLFSWADGRQLRDSGMAEAVAAQDREEAGWSQRAYEVIIALARRQETLHVDDVLAHFPHPPAHPNAWGAVWSKAIRAGIIERTDRVRPSVDPKKHAHLYPVYSSRIGS
jgi:hypothetical protein